MNIPYEELYYQIKNVLEKSIGAQTMYSKAAELAKLDDVKLFFKQKAYNRSLFNDRLMFELNYAFNAPKIDGPSAYNLHSDYQEATDKLIATKDESLLKESFEDDKIALQEYETLLRYTRLPLSIRFIVKEQVTIIKLDALKMEQLITFL